MPTLQTIGYGSSPIPPDRVRDLVAAFGPIFIQLYGMAEIASIGTMLRKDDHAGRSPASRSSSPPRAEHPMPSTCASSTRRGEMSRSGERGEVIFGSPPT